jgi:hypothetical protein
MKPFAESNAMTARLDNDEHTTRRQRHCVNAQLWGLMMVLELL